MSIFQVKFLKTITLFLLFLAFSTNVYAKDNTVTIYLSSDSYVIDLMQQRLSEEFPQYNVVLEYIGTGKHAARIKAEGKNTQADISYDLDYIYLDMLKDYYAPLNNYDTSIYLDIVKPKSNHFLPSLICSATIIVNKDLMKKHNLPMPTSFADLTKPVYKGFISMPSPHFSGVALNFVKGMVELLGEEKAFDYFDKLSENVLLYTPSSSTPVKNLAQGEVAIGLGMTTFALQELQKGSPLAMIAPKEGMTLQFCGFAIVKGKETRKPVQDVMNFLYTSFTHEQTEKLSGESIFKGKKTAIKGYPTNFTLMKYPKLNYDYDQHLLDRWDY